MERPKIILTEDGSHTLSLPGQNEHYHSTFGAMNESRHVFIRAGLKEMMEGADDDLSVLEVGFGTGLNALLSLIEAEYARRKLRYTAIEAFPLEKEIWEKLNYTDLLKGREVKEAFEKMHQLKWGETARISAFFNFEKFFTDIREYEAAAESYSLVYFDAFAPDVQPELWTEEVFYKIHEMTRPGGILVTYSCKGTVKRALRSAGFEIEKLTGPKGKREMLRALKR